MKAGIEANKSPSDAKKADLFREAMNDLSKLILGGPDRYEVAIEVLRDGKDEDTSNFLATWGLSGISDAKIRKIAMNLLNDANPLVRRAAVYTLTPNRKPFFQGRKLGDSIRAPTTAKGQVYAIEDGTERSALMDRLQVEKDSEVRRALIWSLTYSQQVDADVTRRFVEILGGKDDIKTKEVAVHAIWSGRRDKAFEILGDLLKKSDDASLRGRIVMEIGASGGGSLSGVDKDKLLEILTNLLLHDPNDNVRRLSAFSLLVNLPEKEKIPSSVKLAIKEAVRKEKSPAVIEQLRQFPDLDGDSN
jgi:HEAT repeat protein